MESKHGLLENDRIILMSFACQVDRDNVGFSCNYFTITHDLISTVRGT